MNFLVLQPWIGIMLEWLLFNCTTSNLTLSKSPPILTKITLLLCKLIKIVRKSLIKIIIKVPFSYLIIRLISKVIVIEHLMRLWVLKCVKIRWNIFIIKGILDDLHLYLRLWINFDVERVIQREKARKVFLVTSHLLVKSL